LPEFHQAQLVGLCCYRANYFPGERILSVQRCGERKSRTIESRQCIIRALCVEFLAESMRVEITRSRSQEEEYARIASPGFEGSE
jgi:hypothetical protein